MSEKKINILLLIVAITGGFGTVANRIALDGGYLSFQIVAFRLAFSTVFVIILGRKQFFNITKEELRAGLLTCITYWAGFELMLIAYLHTSTAAVSFLMTFNVIFVPILNAIIFRTKIDKYTLIGVSLIIAGSLILSSGEKIGIDLGVVFAVLSCLSFSILNILTEYFLRVKKFEPSRFTIVTMTGSAILSIGTALILEPKIGDVTPKATIYLLLNGIIATGLYMFLNNLVQKYTSGIKVVVSISSQAVFGVIIAMILLGDKISVKEIIAFTLITIAIIISQTKLSFLKKKNKSLQ